MEHSCRAQSVMSRLTLLLLIGLAAAQQLPAGMQMMGGGGGGDEVETHNAEELTDETFEERRLENELLVVLFRNTNDQQAKQVEKEVELAASELSGEDAAIGLGLVDLATAKGAAKKAGISDGPRIAVWQRGKQLKLGPNNYDARSIVNFVRYLTGEVSKQLEGAAAVNEWLRKAETTVVLGIFGDRARPSHNVWMKVAESMRPPHRFAECSVADAQASKLFGKETLDPAKNQFAVVRPHKWLGKDESAYVLSGDFKGMASFVEEHQLTRVYPYIGAARQAWSKAEKAVVMLCLDTERLSKMFKYVVNRLHKLTSAEPTLLDRYAFTIMDTNVMKRNKMGDEFGIDATRDFAVAVYDFKSEHRFGTEELANVSSVDAFSALPLAPWLHQVANGEVAPYIKSEAPPERSFGRGEVHTAVATTFADVVEDEGYDVLLGVYGGPEPKQADAAALAQTAMLFKEVPSFRVASMNVSANLINTTRYKNFLLPRENELRAFLAAGGSAAGKVSPLAFDEKGKQQGLDAVDLAEFVLKHAKRMGGSEHAETLAKIKAEVKKERKRKKEEAEAQFPGLAGMGDTKKKKKKKRRKAGSSKGKEEL